ncbi:MAG: HEAT repeat domain-containing protein [Kofleriaceae bacterium]
MIQACPICGTQVDTLRARAVKVRAGKVVAFCSTECAKAGETQPVRAPIEAVVQPTAAPQPPVATPPRAITPAPAVAPPRAKSAAPAAAPLPPPLPPPELDEPPARTTQPLRDSDPVIEIVHEPASGVVTSARDERIATAPIVPQPPVLPSAGADRSGSLKVSARDKRRDSKDDTLDRWTMNDEDVERAARAATAPTGKKSKRPLAMIIGAVAIAGGGLVAYQHLVASKRPAKVAQQPATPAVAIKPTEPVKPSPTAVTAADAVERARVLLRSQLQAAVPRMQLVAAKALARTKDPDALAVLRGVLGKDTTEIGRFEVAYALGRAGDSRGAAKLADGLRLTSREDRSDAAKKLAMLGDARAIQTLVGFLDIAQLRLSSAEHLAELSEPRAIKVLDQLRADQKASADDRARATIALGMSGRTDVVAELRTLLKDPRFNTQAAEALARLRDNSARPVLERQLTIASLRVRAARALRILDPNLDAKPLLPPLLDALGSDRDFEQVNVAEAILLLAGPVEWSKFP